MSTRILKIGAAAAGLALLLSATPFRAWAQTTIRNITTVGTITNTVKVSNPTAATATSYITARLSNGTSFLVEDTGLTQDTAFTLATTTGGATFCMADADGDVTDVTGGRPVITLCDLNGAGWTKVLSSALPTGAATETSVAATAASVASLATYLQPGSTQRIKSDNTNNDDETQIKGAAGVLLAINGFNSSTSTNAYVRCTNLTAANTTPGSSTIFFDLMLPFGGGAVQAMLGPGGLTFGTALTCYIATGAADSDATDAAQNEVTVNVVYR